MGGVKDARRRWNAPELLKGDQKKKVLKEKSSVAVGKRSSSKRIQEYDLGGGGGEGKVLERREGPKGANRHYNFELEEIREGVLRRGLVWRKKRGTP